MERLVQDIPDDQNFCRVFEIPANFPSDFCFNGGHLTAWRMVDWFNPLAWEREGAWEDLVPQLRAFIAGKRYVRPGRKYLVLTDFGEAVVVDPQAHEPPTASKMATVRP